MALPEHMRLVVDASALVAEALRAWGRKLLADTQLEFLAPTVALALALDCGIWTNDRDFFGCGLPVWVTETLRAHLGGQSGP